MYDSIEMLYCICPKGVRVGWGERKEKADPIIMVKRSQHTSSNVISKRMNNRGEGLR
jgi:hypothetical protein